MKITTPQLIKHSLSLAVLAVIGLSSAMAQESAPPPADPPEAQAAAEANAEAEMATSQQGAPQHSQQQRALQQQTPEQADLRYVTGQAMVTAEDGSQVVIRSRPNLLPRDQGIGARQDTGMTGDYAASGDYSINFSDLDENGDGFISREEAQADPNLSEAFTTADRNSDGMLSPAELEEWAR